MKEVYVSPPMGSVDADVARAVRARIEALVERGCYAYWMPIEAVVIVTPYAWSVLGGRPMMVLPRENPSPQTPPQAPMGGAA